MRPITYPKKLSYDQVAEFYIDGDTWKGMAADRMMVIAVDLKERVKKQINVTKLSRIINTLKDKNERTL